MNIMNTKSAIHLTSATLAALGLLAAAALRADNVTLRGNQTGNQDWATATLWSNDAAASPGNAYFTNGYTLRTPSTANSLVPQVFPGASLTVDGGVGGAMGTLTLKSRITDIADLRLGTATVSSSAGATNILATLNVTNLTALDGKTALLIGNNTNQDLTLNVTNLLGGGALTFGNAARQYALSVTNAGAFTGSIGLLGGTLTLTSDINLTGGAFTMAIGGTNSPTSLVLNNNLVVSSFTFDTTTLNTLGESYTAAQLNAYFSTTRFSGDGLLFIGSTIPEPASIAALLAAAAMLAVTMRRRR
ncbi:PEP-CTERM sorting domain-containing protein [Opitutaceae bacterium TAV4]|nr:PEP-CTERM sorting domain-containing protein [Opitutaceae bacterium TAV4]RRK02188.1 PEP-CTERM sorting domain-containing protein [Opitutaceae bacterium TAV3]